MLPKTPEELNAIRDECKALVTKRAVLSGVAAATPLPGLDVAADIGLLIELINTVNRKFGLTPEQIDHLDSKVKQFIFVAATSIGSDLIGKTLTKELVIQMLKRVGIRVATKSIARYIPIFGQIMAGSISFGVMKMIGNSHVDDCYEVVKKTFLEGPGSGAAALPA